MADKREKQTGISSTDVKLRSRRHQTPLFPGKRRKGTTQDGTAGHTLAAAPIGNWELREAWQCLDGLTARHAREEGSPPSGRKVRPEGVDGSPGGQGIRWAYAHASSTARPCAPQNGGMAYLADSGNTWEHLADQYAMRGVPSKCSLLVNRSGEQPNSRREPRLTCRAEPRFRAGAARIQAYAASSTAGPKRRHG